MMTHPEALPGSEPATNETMYGLYRVGVERVMDYNALAQTDVYGELVEPGRGIVAYVAPLTGDDVRAAIPEAAELSLFAGLEELIVSYSTPYTPEGEVQEVGPIPLFRMLLKYKPDSQRPRQLLELIPWEGGVATEWDVPGEEPFDTQDWMPGADGEASLYDMWYAEIRFRQEEGLNRPTQREADVLTAIVDKIPELLGS